VFVELMNFSTSPWAELGMVHNPAGIFYTQDYKRGRMYKQRWRDVIGVWRVGGNERIDDEKKKNHRNE
jgi:hypothetical protein